MSHQASWRAFARRKNICWSYSRVNATPPQIWAHLRVVSWYAVQQKSFAIGAKRRIDRPWAAAWGLWKNDETDPVGVAPPDGHWIYTIWDLWDQLTVEPDAAKQDEIFYVVEGRGIMIVDGEEYPWSRQALFS